MHKPLFFIGLFLMVQNGLFGQCLALPLCPGVTQIVCDTTENNSNYWSNFYNSPVYSDGLGEVPTELSMQIIDSCTADSLQVSFVLLLDLNADGIRETSVSSDALYSAGLVNYNNVIYPDYTGSQLTAFDSRLVPANEKYKFTIEKIVQDSLVTVRMRWANAMHPNNYVLPELPNGAHRVEWRFEKNGQIRTCGYNFVIKDCAPPTVICVGDLDLTVTLWANTQNFMLFIIDLLSLDPLPYDNYSYNNLTFSARRSGTGTGFPVDNNGNSIYVLTLTCEDIGIQEIEVWTRDLAGNTSFCTTRIFVQPGYAECGGGSFVSYTNLCTIDYCNKEKIEEVDFELTGTHPAIPPFNLYGISDSTGCSILANAIPLGSNITITPAKDDNHLNGVTTYDLVLISKHILNLEALNSPYKIIAADANHSGSVTVADIVELRKLILGIYQKLPNNTSWRFVDTSFVFPNADNPFQTIFPESISVNNVQGNLTKLFYGIKIGDVNCNAIINVNQISEEEALTIPDLHLQTNDIVEVPVRFSQANAYYGFQFGLQFDPTQIELLEVIPVVGTKDNFGLFQDRVNVSWSAINSALFLPDEPAFRLRIKALVPLHLAAVFRLTTEKLHAEAYSESDNPINLRLQFATTAPEATQTIFNPQPNPTSAGIRLPLRLEQSETVTIEILDGTGRILYQQAETRSSGTQWLEVPARAFPQAGVYMWRVVAGVESKAGKIIKQ